MPISINKKRKMRKNIKKRVVRAKKMLFTMRKLKYANNPVHQKMLLRKMGNNDFRCIMECAKNFPKFASASQRNNPKSIQLAKMLSNPNITIAQKKKYLTNNQTGGFIGSLLGIAIPALTGLIKGIGGG